MLHGKGITNQEIEDVYKEIVKSNVITGMKSVLNALNELTADSAYDKYFVDSISGAETTMTQGWKFLNEDHEVCEMDHIQNCKAYLCKSSMEDEFDTRREEIEQVINFLWGHPVIQEVWKHRAKFQI